MSDLFSRPLREVLRVAASSEPVPGGGSVSAIAGCFGAAMVSMVANLTIGKKKYRDVEGQAVVIRDRALSLMNRLEALVDEDMTSFQRFMDVYKMPRETPEQEHTRALLMEEALKASTETPLRIARACLEGLELAAEIASIGSKMAISDAGVAANLLGAALESALLNVDINLPSIKDEEFKRASLEERLSLSRRAQELKDRCLSLVREKMTS